MKPGDPLTPRSARPPRGVPSATYRLQLHSGFGLQAATALLPYLDALGISHLYCSPYLKARRGSPHGYDVIDHGMLNPEVGDEADLERLATELGRRGLSQVLDFVPNHVGIGQGENAWWLDVLEYGPESPYAAFFDIDWRPAKIELRGKVLLPFLGDHYGRVLERGELSVSFDPEEGGFSVWYYEHRFPLARRSVARLLDGGLAELRSALPPEHAALAELARIATELRRRGGRALARERAEAAKRALAALAGAEPAVRAWLDRLARELSGAPGFRESFRRLHRLLEMQHWRLAYWRVAADEINYRRFFDINDLAGLKMERRDLFEITHRLVFRWIDEGKASGLRIDHIDGLSDPRGYCERLRAHAGKRPLWIVVEKILAPHERLRADWSIAGTTGYEFLNLVNGLLIDPAAERPLVATYRRFTESPADFEETLYACKKHVMNFMLGSELQVLANELDRLSEAGWRTRDFTLTSLKEALKEVVACFPVYRTYVSERGATAEDRRELDRAVAEARRRSSDPEVTLFDWIHGVLTTDVAREKDSGYPLREVVRFVRRFQQYTSPVTAKALEDTSFYRDARLLALNEVGGDPQRFGVSLDEFHDNLEERAREWPHAMLTTSTHDTKRGEDVRARLDVLSELTDEWDVRVRRWAELNRDRKRTLEDRPAPGPNDEYFLYQTLLGSWPLELAEGGSLAPAPLAHYRERVERYAIKAVRESKLRSSWRHPNAEYEEALLAFVRALLDGGRNPFLADFVPFARRVAELGMLNGLAQQLIKLTAPGVPDVYQGCEFWDLSLADPDNRRPVDFEAREQQLAALDAEQATGEAEAVRRAHARLASWPDGRVKLWLVAQLLRFRREHPTLLLEGDYRRLHVTGRERSSICAFARARGEAHLLVVAPLRWARRIAPGAGPLPSAESWGTTAVRIPFARARAYRDVISGLVTPCQASIDGARLPLAAALRGLPLAALVPLSADEPA